MAVSRMLHYRILTLLQPPLCRRSCSSTCRLPPFRAVKACLTILWLTVLQALKEAGGDMQDVIVERLWNIIQALSPSTVKPSAGGGKGGGTDGGARPHPKPKSGARLPGLALEDTRDYLKKMDDELLREAEEKVAAIGASSRKEKERREDEGPSSSGRDREGGRRDSRGGEREGRENSRRDRSRERERDRDRDRDRERDPDRRSSRDRDRERDRERDRDREGGRGRDYDRDREGSRRDRSSSRERKRRREDMPPPAAAAATSHSGPPELGSVYRGKVTGMMQFGCFVELLGFRQKAEGLVHLSNLSAARVGSAQEVVQRGQEVWVKVVSVAGNKIGLSMRDVDQNTGKDLLDLGAMAGKLGDAPPGATKSGLAGISGIKVNPEDFEENTRRYVALEAEMSHNLWLVTWQVGLWGLWLQ